MAQATLSWPSANSPCVRAKNRLDFVPALARAGSLRRWVLLYPKPSPRGEGAPVRTLGRMRGRFGTQPFLVEVENGGAHLSPQRNFSPAPLGNPVAPSSVTFGDSFPPRGSLRRRYTPATKSFLAQPLLPQKANPNQGTQMGTETAPPPEQCATTAKTSEWERAGHKKRGGGGPPPRLFASGLSLRESLDPRPGPGGKPRRRF